MFIAYLMLFEVMLCLTLLRSFRVFCSVGEALRLLQIYMLLTIKLHISLVTNGFLSCFLGYYVHIYAFKLYVFYQFLLPGNQLQFSR